VEDPTRLIRSASGRHLRRWFLAVALVWVAVVVAGVVRAAAEEPYTDAARRLADGAKGAAAEDRHVDAVVCGLAALELDPSLEDELALMIAFHLLWQERAEESIPWFRSHLSRHPDDREAMLGLARALSWTGDLKGAGEIYARLAEDDPDNVEARLGVARMHAWDGRHGAAAREYGAVLELEPDNAEATLGLARAENRRGKHRHAEELLEAWLEEHPEDADARAELARARFWMGEGDAALETIAGDDSPAAEDVRQAVLADRRLKLEAFGSHWEDVDDQEVNVLGVGAEKGFGGGWRANARASRHAVDEPGAEEIAAAWFTGGADWQPNRHVALHGRLTMDVVGSGLDDADVLDAGAGETRTGEDVKSTRLRFETWGTWFPADRTRLDAGFARLPVETPKARVRDVHADVFSAGVDRGLTDRWTVRGGGAISDYSDGNSRWAVEGEIEFGPIVPVRHVDVDLAAGALRYEFDESPDHGYYAPSTYDAVWLGTTIGVGLGPFVRVEGDVRVASEKEEDEDRFGVASGGLTLSWTPVERFWMSVFARKSTSRFDTDAGYEREGFGASVFFLP
jgi:tetratricopeptide (TPR) repeat protein